MGNIFQQHRGTDNVFAADVELFMELTKLLVMLLDVLHGKAKEIEDLYKVIILTLPPAI